MNVTQTLEFVRIFNSKLALIDQEKREDLFFTIRMTTSGWIEPNMLVLFVS